MSDSKSKDAVRKKLVVVGEEMQNGVSLLSSAKERWMNAGCRESISYPCESDQTCFFREVAFELRSLSWEERSEASNSEIIERMSSAMKIVEIERISIA